MSWKIQKLTLEEEQKILDLYVKENLSIIQIYKKTHINPATISNFLKKQNIPIVIGLKKTHPSMQEQQIIQQIINNKGSYAEIQRTIHKDYQTVKRYVKELKLKYDYHPYNKNLKHDFFSVIDSSEKAWLLGMLFTDGSVRQDKGFQIRLQLQLQDEEIIDKIMKLLNIDTGKRYDLRPKKHCVILEFCSERIFNDIQKYGIIPKKTYIIDKLYLELIPDQFHKDYIRGLFDGDGGLSFTGNIWEVSCDFTSHFRKTVEEFQLYIDKNINKDQHNKIKTTPSKSRCAWRGRQQVLKICSFLYEGASIYLNRKHQKYLWIKNTSVKNK